MSEAKCRKCEAPINFIRTVKGKWMPVETELVSYEEVPVGMLLVTQSGQTYKRYEDSELKSKPNLKGYISHFNLCPYADNFSGSKK